MQINTNYHFNPVGRTNSTPPATPAQSAPRAEDTASFPDTKRLQDAVAQSPASRANQVARAKELVKQSDYPPAEMVRKIGSLIAGHLE